MRKILLLGVAAVALGGGYAFWPDGVSLGKPATWSVASWGKPSAEQKYRTAPAERGRLAASVNSTGPLQPVAVVNIGSQVSGQIVELRADYNSPVRKGDILAIFDPEPYQYAIEQSEAELSYARSAVTVQEAALDRAEAELMVAQAEYAAAKANTQQALISMTDYGRNLERKKTLVSGGTATTVEREQAQTAYDTARAVWAAADATARGRAGTVTGIEAQIRSAAAQIETARATVAQNVAALRQAKKSLEQSIIRSPVDGIVIDRLVEAGQIVAASLQAPTLFTIAQDLKEMQIKASVDEADIGLIREGQEVTFTVDAFPNRTFHGRVKQIRKQAYVVQFVVTYTVVVSAPNPELLLMPGMTANAKIVLAERDNVLRVPNAALRVKLDRAGPRSPHIWVLDDDGPRVVPVRAGITDGTYVEVTGDIEEGKPVIVGVDAEKGSSPKVFGTGL
jgi:HlyD family secretion protein